MAVRWRDMCVVERSPFDGQRQKEALTGFQKAAKLDATAAARAVNLSYPQYNRYLWGRLPLRTDQIEDFAAAYGVTKADLTRALGLLDDMPSNPSGRPWTIRAALRGRIPEDVIDEIVEDREHDPLDDQKAAVMDILRVYEEVQARASAEMLARLRQRDRPA